MSAPKWASRCARLRGRTSKARHHWATFGALAGLSDRAERRRLGGEVGELAADALQTEALRLEQMAQTIRGAAGHMTSRCPMCGGLLQGPAPADTHLLGELPARLGGLGETIGESCRAGEG